MEITTRPAPTGEDEFGGQLAFPTSAVGVEAVICSKQIPNGRKARLVQVANAVDPGGEPFFIFRVKVNGNPVNHPVLSKFGNNSFGAVGTTYDPSQRMTIPLRIPEGCLLELTAELTVSSVDGSDPTADYTAYGRVKVEYENYD